MYMDDLAYSRLQGRTPLFSSSCETSWKVNFTQKKLFPPFFFSKIKKNPKLLNGWNYPVIRGGLGRLPTHVTPGSIFLWAKFCKNCIRELHAPPRPLQFHFFPVPPFLCEQGTWHKIFRAVVKKSILTQITVSKFPQKN